MWYYVAWVALFSLSYYLRLRDKAAPIEKQTDVSLPIAREGDPAPLIWGQCLVRQGNVVWQGKLESRDITQFDPGLFQMFGVKVGEVVTGYEYYIPFQMVVGIPGYKHCNILDLKVNEKSSGGIPWPNAIGNYTWLMFNTSTLIAAWSGGDPDTDGNFDLGFKMLAEDQGYPAKYVPNYKGYAMMTFYQGLWTGTTGGYDANSWGGGTGWGVNSLGHVPSVDPTVIGIEPFGHVTIDHFFGQASLAEVNARPAGWPIGQTASPDPYSFEVLCDCAGAIYDGDPSFYLGPIGADANPMNVLWLLLTRDWGQGGIDYTKVDAANFYQVGKVLEAEGQGFSYVQYQTTDLSSMIREIEHEVMGVLYQDNFTRQLKFKLIRNDYLVPSLPMFDKTNISDEQAPKFSTTMWTDTYNQVRLTFNSRRQGYTDRVAVAQNLANIQMQSKIRSLDLNYPGIHDETIAAFVAARELKAVSRPITKVSFQVNRDAWALQVASPFVINWIDDETNISNVVFRATKVDEGELGSERVMIEAVEDIFSVDQEVFSFPPFHKVPVPAATPILEYRVQEAPRWLQLQAVNAGQIGNSSQQHIWYLGVPNTNDVRIQGQVGTSSTSYAQDTDRIGYPGRCVLKNTYSKNNSPYDTTVGIVVQSVEGVTLKSANNPADIGTKGTNLIVIDDEIIGYETVTDNLDGSYTLTNLWRGLADTIPQDHVAGVRSYFITTTALLFVTSVDVKNIGKNALTIGETFYGRTMPWDALRPLAPDTDQPYSALAIRGRTLLPYPVANLRVNGSNTPSQIYEEGVDVYWNARQRFNPYLKKGTDDQEVQGETTTWSILGKKNGLNPFDAQVLKSAIAYDGAHVINTPNVTQQALSKAGHGALDVSVRSTTSNGDSWADPSVTIDAPHWRNHLLDPRFALNNGSWTVDSGSPVIVGSGGFGNAAYPTGPGDFQLSETISLHGYRPSRLTALMTFYAWNGVPSGGGAADQVIATVTALDDFIVLGTATVTVVPSATKWERFELAYPDLPAGTTRVRVTLKCHQLATALTSTFTDVALRVGQIYNSAGTYHRFSNAGFESGTTASWAVGSGTFSVNTTVKYEGVDYVRCDTTGTISQDAFVPAGYEYCTAFLEFGRLNEIAGAADPGEVQLIAVDSLGNTLSSVTTGSETITPVQTWQRRRLALDIPINTYAVRAAFTGTHSATSKACADDFRLYFCKHLDPDISYSVPFYNQAVQHLPNDYNQWLWMFPNITAPDYLIHNFRTPQPAYFGTTCAMVPGVHVVTNSLFSGYWDGTSQTTSCVELTSDCRFESIQVYNNSAFANFDIDTSFTFMVFGKFDGDETYTDSQTILGRTDGTTGTIGFILEADATGKAVAKMSGSLGTATATGFADIKTGSNFWAAIAYDASVKRLYVYDPSGASSVDVSGIGSINEALGYFKIGFVDNPDGFSGMRGQLARVYGWKSFVSYADLKSTVTHGTDTGYSYVKTGTWMMDAMNPTGTTGDHALVRSGDDFDKYVKMWSDDWYAYDGNGWTIPVQPVVTNLAPTCDFSSFNWNAFGPFTLVANQRGPEGVMNSWSLTGDSTAYAELSNIPVGAGNINVVWWYHGGAVAANIEVELVSATGVVIDTYSFAKSVRDVWVQARHTFTWTAPSATCKLRFYASVGASQTLLFAPYIGVFQGVDDPICIPCKNGTPGSAGAYITYSFGMETQLNSEGEIYVEANTAGTPTPSLGTLVNVWNTSNDQDRRRIRVGPSAPNNVTLEHYDGVGVVNSANNSIADWTHIQRLRARWCRAEVFDASAKFSTMALYDAGGVYTPAYGRTASWTPGTLRPIRIEVGHAAGADVFTGLVRQVNVLAREVKL